MKNVWNSQAQWLWEVIIYRAYLQHLSVIDFLDSQSHFSINRIITSYLGHAYSFPANGYFQLILTMWNPILHSYMKVQYRQLYFVSPYSCEIEISRSHSYTLRYSWYQNLWATNESHIFDNVNTMHNAVIDIKKKPPNFPANVDCHNTDAQACKRNFKITLQKPFQSLFTLRS